jgi:hypothetical protein
MRMLSGSDRPIIGGVIFLPVTLVLWLLLGLLLVVIVVLVELRVLAYAYQKIGVRPRYVFGLLLLTLLGSHVNVRSTRSPSSESSLRGPSGSSGDPTRCRRAFGPARPWSR